MDTISAKSASPLRTSVSEEVTRCLSRINLENDKWHAVSQLFAANALRKALKLDQHVARGGKPAKLHGLPFVIKELVDLKGVITPFGSTVYKSESASQNAQVVDRLEAEGAVLLGTAHMVEFAIGSWGTNTVRGTPWNPADPEVHRVPGGSSSGSAVAVAAGLVPAAIGSDTGGSIRIPASLCGVIGYKPTYGLIPTDGVAPLGPTFDTLGPITRTIDDARRLTEVMSERVLSHQSVSFDGLKVAVVSSSALAPISPEIEQAYEGALQRLKQMGASIREIELPLSFSEFQRLNGDIVSYEIYSHIAHIAEDPSSLIDVNIRNRVLAGRSISAEQYSDDLKELKATRETFQATFADFDVLVLPGTPICAAPLSEVDESQIPMSRYTRIANCLDMCAVTLPLARTSDNLPIGWQLCAPGNCDAFLLALAEEAEKDVLLGSEIRKLTTL
ncbi:hypothetical protein BOO25_13810 [Vibrio navarrensis]|uniref:amidase n=1 Tax=Vibrio navarrensis TaxID=29495 RepID=UPI00192F361B|nr:amidase [Vibrio navarrensis]MBE3669992.1 hypothetical protein [Vibrio navarrensis]